MTYLSANKITLLKSTKQRNISPQKVSIKLSFRIDKNFISNKIKHHNKNDINFKIIPALAAPENIKSHDKITSNLNDQNKELSEIAPHWQVNFSARAW